jgi:hypothetical protein
MDDTHRLTRLRDKFLQAEVDYENRRKYNSSVDKASNRKESEAIEKQNEKQKETLTLLVAFFKIFKIVIFRTRSIFSFALGHTAKFFSKISNFFEKIIQYYSKKKENAEFFIESKIESYEKKQNSRMENANKQSMEALTQVDAFKDEIKRLFSGVDCDFCIDDESMKVKTLKANLDFHIVLYEEIVKKITESRLIVNLCTVKISIRIKNENVKNSIDFKLKLKGHTWGTLFSKYISNSLFKKIQVYDGRLYAKHLYNPLRKIDVFTLYFEHSLLYSYVEIVDFESSQNVMAETKKSFPKKANSQKIMEVGK